MVFQGTVLSIKLGLGTDAMGRRSIQRFVTLRVVERFRGATASAVTVMTGFGGGDCGYPFQVGRRYLVYTYKNEASGVEETYVCSRTAPADRAAEDLTFLRALATKGPEGRIFGYVTSLRPPYWESYTGQGGLAGISVWLQSDNVVMKTLTDSAGNFEFRNLHPGSHRVCVDRATKLEGDDSVSFTLPPQSCRALPFIARE